MSTDRIMKNETQDTLLGKISLRLANNTATILPKLDFWGVAQNF